MKTLTTMLAVALVVSIFACLPTLNAAVIRHSQQFVEYVETSSTQAVPLPEKTLQLANEIKTIAPEISDPYLREGLLKTSRLLEEGKVTEAITEYQKLMDYATSLLESGELSTEEYGELLRIFSQASTLASELPVSWQTSLRNYYATYFNSLSSKLYSEGVVNNDEDLIRLAKELKDLSYSLESGKLSLNDVEKALDVLKEISSKEQGTLKTLENVDRSLSFLKNIASSLSGEQKLLPEARGGLSLVKNYASFLKAPSLSMFTPNYLAPNVTTLTYIGAIVATALLTYFLITFLRRFSIKASARKVVEKIRHTVRSEGKAKALISGVVEAYWYAVGFLSKLIPKLNHETHREYLEKIKAKESDVKDYFEKLTFLYEKDRFSKRRASEEEFREAMLLAKKIESTVLKKI